MFEDERRSNTLEELFLQRKKSFLDSLERSIKVICSDQQLSRLFKEKSSSSYVPDRICSIIENCLRDDREDFINESFSKIHNIEACFGSKTLEEIEKLGKKILNMPALSQNNEKIRQACLKKLENQIKKITLQYFPHNSDLVNIQMKNKLKKQLLELKNYSVSLGRNIEQFENDFHQTIHSVKSKINEQISTNSKSPKRDKVQTDPLLDESTVIQTLVQMQNYSKTRDQEKETEIEQLKRSLRESKSQIDELMEENSSLKTNLNKSLENNKKIRSTIGCMKNSNLSLNLDDSDIQSDDDFADYIKELKNENELAKTDIKNLKSQNEQLLAENLDFREQSIRMSNSMNRSSQNLEEQSQVAEKLTSENKRLKSVNSQLLTASKALQQQNKEILNQVGTLKKERDLLKTKILQMSRKIKNTETLKSTLQNQVSDLTALHDLSKSDNEIFKENTAKELQKLQAENKELMNTNTELSTELEKFKNTSLIQNKDLSKQSQINEQLQAENDLLNKQVKQYEQQLQTIRKEKDTNDKELTKCKEKLEQIEEEKNLLEKENKELQVLHEESLNNCAELKDAADALSILNTQLKTQNNDLHSINQTTQLEKQSYIVYKNRIETLQDQYNDSLMTISKLQAENSSLKETQTEIKLVKEKNEKMLAQNNEYMNLTQQMKLEMKEMELRLVDKDRKISQLNNENAKSEAKLKETEDKLDSIKAANNLIGTKADQVLTLISQNENLQKSLKSNEIELSKASELNSKLSRSLQKSRNKNKALINELDVVSSENQRLLSKSQNFEEIKRRLSQINQSKSLIENENEQDGLDDIQKVSEIIYELRKENRENCMLIKKQTEFSNNVLKKLECETLTDASNKFEQLIKKSILFEKVGNLLNCHENEKIFSKIQEINENYQKSKETEQLIRKALRLQTTDNSNGNSDVYNAILVLRAKTENSENLIAKEKEKNSSLISRLCGLLQTEESRLPLTIQTMMAKNNDDRIFYKQLRSILQISNDNQILETVHANQLQLNELQDTIEKVRAIVKFANLSELVQMVQELKSKSNLLMPIKDLLKIEHDSEIFKSVQSLIAFQTRIKQTSINNSDEYSQITDIQDNSNLISQLLSIAQVDNKNELPLYIQNLKNYIEQINDILHVQKISEALSVLNKILRENSEIDQYKSKLNEKSQQMNQMKNMVQSLEMQFNEISNIATQKQKETDQTSFENETLQTSLKNSTFKLDQVSSKLQKKKEVIEKLKRTLQSQIHKYQQLQSKIKAILTELGVDDIDKIVPFVQSLQKDLARMDTIPFSNEGEMKKLNTFHACLKDISSVLISTDINNFSKEIEELKSQNDELNKIKKYLSYSLSLKLNESLTNKVDTIMKERNEAQNIFDKLCVILDVPSRDEIAPAVNILLNNLNDMKNESKMLQNAVSANSKQSLLKNVKSMKQTVKSFIDLYNLNDETEIQIFNQIITECGAQSLSQLKERIDELLKEESSLNMIQKEFKVKTVDDVNGIMAKSLKFEKIKDFISQNIFGQISSEIQIISELLEFRQSIEKFCKSDNCIQEISDLVQFKDKIINQFGMKTENDIQRVIQKVTQIESLYTLLNSHSIPEVNDRIHDLLTISENYQRVLSEFNVDNDVQLKIKMSQLQDDLRASQTTHKLLKAENEEQLRTQIQKLMKNEKKLCKILSLNDPILIQSRVSALLQLNSELTILFGTPDVLTVSKNLCQILNHICQILNYEKVTLMMINSSTSQSQQHTFSNTTDMKFNGIEKAVEKLNTDYNSAVSIFTKLLSIVLGKENITAQFPLSSEFEANLLGTISQMKERSKQCQIILSKAKSSGYNGENCEEASNYLLQKAKKQQELLKSKEKQKEFEKLNNQLILEKKNFEEEKQKLMKINLQLKLKVEELTNHEESLMKKMKKEKKKRQMTQLNFIKEKEVNESLVTILHGQGTLPYSADSQIMRSPFKE